ncbi:hypothetical protein FZW96_04050 [Bacillus sp. BGMRC 2118]|nr:hypothetical protein FZW96_04050 [Bacillus sp. BGMRC 2118]
MNKNLVLFDIIFYVALPLIIWNMGREIIGDYYAMLLSSVPGIIYTLIRFMKTKKWNVTGIFIVSTLTVGVLVDVLSGNALQLLWNNVYYSFVMSVFFIVTILIRKPMALLFALDVVEMQGYNREETRVLFCNPKIYKVYILITIAMGLRGLIIGVINSQLIMKYGVDAFDQGIIFKQVVGWVMTGITFFGYLYVMKLSTNLTDKKISA